MDVMNENYHEYYVGNVGGPPQVIVCAAADGRPLEAGLVRQRAHDSSALRGRVGPDVPRIVFVEHVSVATLVVVELSENRRMGVLALLENDAGVNILVHRSSGRKNKSIKIYLILPRTHWNSVGLRTVCTQGRKTSH